MKYCALCCTACDEDLFLKEWLAYHARLGFEHFIIYDDCSETPIRELLGAWARPKCVTVVRHAAKRDQIATYTQCLADFGPDFQWIAFLDVDEFIRLGPVPRSKREEAEPGPETGRAVFSDIRLFLSHFEPYAAVGLNWRMFSSAGHESRPGLPVIGAYDRCLGDDIHIKSVVQPSRIRGVASPHAFYPRQGERAVTASRFPLPPGFAFAVPETAAAAVNHYFYKSRECFSQKLSRGNPCNIKRRMDEFERQLGMPTTRDRSLAAHADSAAAAVRAERMPEAEALVHLDAERLGGLPGDGLGNARAYLAEGAAGDGPALRQALLHLAYVSLCNGADGRPDQRVEFEVWTLRAEAALLDGHGDLAHYCLERAMGLGAGKEAYALYARWLLEKGNREGARHALDILGAHGARR